MIHARNLKNIWRVLFAAITVSFVFDNKVAPFCSSAIRTLDFRLTDPAAHRQCARDANTLSPDDG